MSGASSQRSAGAARLLIVDDHELARTGLVNVLAGDASLKVVGEAATGREAIELCQQLLPDLVLMDIRMPDLDGLAATREIKAGRPETIVLIVSMHEDPDYLFEAVKAGAAGYVLKGASAREIRAAVHSVLDGEAVLPPELATQLLRRLAQPRAEHPPSPLEPLTRREMDVLELLVQGMTNRRIADALVVTHSTVKGHVEHIMRKLEASDRTQAAVRALQLGLVGHPRP